MFCMFPMIILGVLVGILLTTPLFPAGYKRFGGRLGFLIGLVGGGITGVVLALLLTEPVSHMLISSTDRASNETFAVDILADLSHVLEQTLRNRQ